MAEENRTQVKIAYIGLAGVAITAIATIIVALVNNYEGLTTTSTQHGSIDQVAEKERITPDNNPTTITPTAASSSETDNSGEKEKLAQLERKAKVAVGAFVGIWEAYYNNATKKTDGLTVIRTNENGRLTICKVGPDYSYDGIDKWYSIQSFNRRTMELKFKQTDPEKASTYSIKPNGNGFKGKADGGKDYELKPANISPKIEHKIWLVAKSCK